MAGRHWCHRETAGGDVALRCGDLDRVDVAEVPNVNDQIRRELREKGADLLADIRDSKELSDATAAKIDAIVTSVVEQFAPSVTPV